MELNVLEICYCHCLEMLFIDDSYSISVEVSYSPIYRIEILLNGFTSVYVCIRHAFHWYPSSCSLFIIQFTQVMCPIFLRFILGMQFRMSSTFYMWRLKFNSIPYCFDLIQFGDHFKHNRAFETLNGRRVQWMNHLKV